MRKPPPSPRLRLEELPTRELIARGEALLATHDYKDAIDVYKLLLKREPQAGWHEALASAYLERARQLASKGMYREAAVLWENIPSLCGQTRQPELYVDWLLQTSQYAKAMRAYAATCRRAVRRRRTGNPARRRSCWPGRKTSSKPCHRMRPCVGNWTAAQAALRAYGQGEAEAVVRECLQNIPIRSPVPRPAAGAFRPVETGNRSRWRSSAGRTHPGNIPLSRSGGNRPRRYCPSTRPSLAGARFHPARFGCPASRSESAANQAAQGMGATGRASQRQDVVWLHHQQSGAPGPGTGPPSLSGAVSRLSQGTAHLHQVVRTVTHARSASPPSLAG